VILYTAEKSINTNVEPGYVDMRQVGVQIWIGRAL